MSTDENKPQGVEHELLDFSDHIDLIVGRTGTLLEFDRLVAVPPAKRVMGFAQIAVIAARNDQAIAYAYRDCGMGLAMRREAMKYA